jgi:GDP/UDP-N,N'-diacetylbacillosamine 2-epimerase (hydrolysing)
MKTTVCVVTGSRSEYGLLEPVLHGILHSHMKLQFVVTGAHLSEQFGCTMNEIIFRADRTVDLQLILDSNVAIAKSIGTAIIGLSDVFSDLHPDIVLVLGDRYETLAAAVAAVYCGCIVAHIHGGDSAGAGLDESARHAITKLAHLHFTATQSSYERVIKMGENPAYVYQTGSPALDSIPPKLPKLNENDQYLVMIQHPVTLQEQKVSYQLCTTFDAIRRTGLKTFVFMPNADAGGLMARSVIGQQARRPQFIIINNLTRTNYLGLLKYASAIVGNSSSGIIDSTALGVPAVNIGSRQDGRERGDNVVDVPHNTAQIEQAIRRCMTPEYQAFARTCISPYGDGHASERIVQILENIVVTPELSQKKLMY